MNTAALGRVLLCLALGVGLLAAIVTVVPPPVQVLAAMFILPVQSLLFAFAVSDRRRTA